MKTACSSYKKEGSENHCPLLSELRSTWFLIVEEQINDLWHWRIKNMDGSEQLFWFSNADWHCGWCMKDGNKECFRETTNAPAFSHLWLHPGSKKLLPTQSQHTLVNMGHKTRIITLSFTSPLLVTLLADVVLPTSGPTTTGEIQWSRSQKSLWDHQESNHQTSAPPSYTHHSSTPTNFVTDEMHPSVTDRNTNDRFLQWRS